MMMAFLLMASLQIHSTRGVREMGTHNDTVQPAGVTLSLCGSLFNLEKDVAVIMRRNMRGCTKTDGCEVYYFKDSLSDLACEINVQDS